MEHNIGVFNRPLVDADELVWSINTFSIFPCLNLSHFEPVPISGQVRGFKGSAHHSLVHVSHHYSLADRISTSASRQLPCCLPSQPPLVAYEDPTPLRLSVARLDPVRVRSCDDSRP